MAVSTLTRDSFEWLEWKPEDLTQDAELLKALEDEELNTLGAAWEAQCSGVVKIDGLGEAFEAFFAGYPDFAKVVEAVDSAELVRLREKEQLLEKIRKTAAKSRKLKGDLDKAKDYCKEIKRSWEEAVSTLTLLCDSAKTGQKLLPIDERPQKDDEDDDSFEDLDADALVRLSEDGSEAAADRRATAGGR